MADGVVICALRGWPRWLGLIGVATAILGLSVATPPDIWVDEQGRIVAVRDGDTLCFTSTRRGAFEQKAWARYIGGADIKALAYAPTALAQCDTAGCVIAADAATIAISLSPHGLGDDCRRADYVIALYRAVAGEAVGCPDGTPALVLFDLQRDGAHALWIGDSAITIRSVATARGA
jgi:hypothetical protein